MTYNPVWGLVLIPLVYGVPAVLAVGLVVALVRTRGRDAAAAQRLVWPYLAVAACALAAMALDSQFLERPRSYSGPGEVSPLPSVWAWVLWPVPAVVLVLVVGLLAMVVPDRLTSVRVRRRIALTCLLVGALLLLTLVAAWAA